MSRIVVADPQPFIREALRQRLAQAGHEVVGETGDGREALALVQRLHPDLLPALGRLIIAASKHTQVWVVSHASRLIATLEEHPECNCLHLDKELGQTRIRDQGMFDAPAWHWAD